MNTKPIERIDSLNPAHVGASMPGTVVDIRTSVGKRVEKGEPLVVLSAMKMETVIAAPRAGFVKRIVAEVSPQRVCPSPLPGPRLMFFFGFPVALRLCL